MLKVYTVAPGLVARIGNHGEASNDVPALVPNEEAEGLAMSVALGTLRVEAEAGESPIAWHAATGDVYHTDPSCTVGNNVERANLRLGKAGLKKCSLCGPKPAKAPKAPAEKKE